jgi:hypothetical protein
MSPLSTGIKLLKQEPYDLHCLSDPICKIKSRRMRWWGHMARMGGTEAHAGFWSGNLKARWHLKDLYIDGSTMVKWKLKDRMEECGLDSSGSGHGLVAGS